MIGAAKKTSGRATWFVVFSVATAAAASGWILAAQQDIDLQILRNAAQALFEEKQTSASAGAFARVVESVDASASDWLNLALARYELGADEDDDREILVALDRAAELDPANPGAPYLRGLVHSRRGRDAVAATQFAAAADLDGTDAATLYNWAAALHNLGRVDEALGLYERVVAMGFDVAQQFFVSSLYRAGRALAVRDGIEVARPYIERYAEFQRRLSQAQRAPTALEAGRYKRVVVPRVNLAPAVPATAREIVFVSGGEIALPQAPPPQHIVVADLGHGVRILYGAPAPAGPGGGTAAVDGGHELFPLEVVDGVMAIGDYDRDGQPDVLVLGAEQTVLLRGIDDTASGLRFESVAFEGIPVFAAAAQAVWVDADHDGDLDILAVTGETGAGFRWIANHGGGSFAEMTASAGLGGPPARQIAWADFDDDNDVDFWVLRRDGTGALYSNARGGRFEEIGAAVGAAGPGGVSAVVAEDMDNDGWFDLVLGGTEGLVVLANNGDGTFRTVFVDTTPVEELFAADLNNDGWLDLVLEDGRVLVNSGGLSFSPLGRPEAADGLLLALADRTGDGALDMLMRSDDRLRWVVQEAPVGNWTRVALAGVKANLRGIGAMVEAKSAGLYQRRLQRGRWLHFGLGDRSRIDVVRITWPNGIIQNETGVAANAALGPIGEVERLEGSCPLLYTWDGKEWRFINEVLGVAPLGMPLATDVIHAADFDEYVPIPGAALRARDGMFEVRLTEELREVGYLDAVRLLAVDKPAGVQTVPDERFVAPPHPEFGIYAVTKPRAVTARDQAGRDWTAELAQVDGSWARPFEPYLYEGLATGHSLELTLAGMAGLDEGTGVRLFLTGWVYWATGSINLQVDQDPRVTFAPVALEVPDGAGGWRVAIPDIGLPNAKNTTLVVELGGHLLATDPRVRLATTMRLYWDAAFYTVGDGAALYRPAGEWQSAWRVPEAGPLDMVTSDGDALLHVHVLAPESADIRWRGFSALLRDADGFETFDYATVVSDSNWNQHRGSYTRYGAVGELLATADDRLVIVGTGDEVSVRFADKLPPLPDGWQRDWLLYLNGWVKDGDPNTLGGERVEPLPYHAMDAYPDYAATANTEPQSDGWWAAYNTRLAREVNAPLRPRR